MPRDSSKSPRIYFYYGYQEIRAKTLADALSQRADLATKGNSVREGGADTATAIALQSAPPTNEQFKTVIDGTFRAPLPHKH